MSRLSTGSNAASHEVQVAAQLENATGSTIKMVDRPPANPDGSFPKSPDFVFASGPNAGKTGDFMFTAEPNRAPSMNTYFDKNWPKTEASLNAHLTKADVVVLDFTNLTPVNQLKVNDWINTLTPAQRGQILIRR
jgi:filamentous hemagglutinin